MPICQWQERNWHIIKLADWHIITGGLAQLARASALHAEGQRFESVILHQKNISNGVNKIFDVLDNFK